MQRSDTWQTEKYYNLRERSVLKSSYRQAGESKYGPDLCSNCIVHKAKEQVERENRTWRRNLIALVMVAAVFCLYMLLIRKVPYCSPHRGHGANFAEGHMSHCDYDSEEHFSLNPFALTCKPCPKNAECTGPHTMVGKIFIHAHSAHQSTNKKMS